MKPLFLNLDLEPMMRRLLLLHCFFLTAVALVHSFTGPSSSSPSSRMAVVVGASIASRQWQPQRPTTYLCTASKVDDTTWQQQRPNPKTFREGEVLGLRLMQSGKHDEALRGEFTCVIFALYQYFSVHKTIQAYASKKYIYIHPTTSSIPTGHEVTGFANGHCTHTKCIRTIAGRWIQGWDGVANDCHVGHVRITGWTL